MIIIRDVWLLLVVASLSGFDFLAVLLVIGLLIVLSVRFRVMGHTILLLIIIGVLLLALISLGKLTMALFAAVLVLGVLLIVFLFRRSFEGLLLSGDYRKA